MAEYYRNTRWQEKLRRRPAQQGDAGTEPEIRENAWHLESTEYGRKFGDYVVWNGFGRETTVMHVRCEGACVVLQWDEEAMLEVGCDKRVIRTVSSESHKETR
jgi:hypothetical protein